MRQRKIKDLEDKLAAYAAIIVEDPASARGRWREVFAERLAGKDASGFSGRQEIYMELGCGKGRFITTMAQRNPDKLYIAVEGAESVVLRALEKAGELGLKNLLFIKQYMNDLTEFFEDGELAGLYLNFSDPWPKDRHAKRRLTHRGYLQSYKRILPAGSYIEFKTDNDGLFAFSLPEFIESGLEIVEQTTDLHKSDYPAKEVETEYEHKFRLLGSKINYCKVRI